MADTPLKDLRILWVEDDAFLAEFITKTLTDAGAEVIYVNTGEQALEKIEKEKFDAAVVDLLLPGVDGWEVITKVRAGEKTSEIPIIVFSNLGRQEDVNRGIELGADRFIVKSSIHPKELISEVQKAFETRGKK